MASTLIANNVARARIVKAMDLLISCVNDEDLWDPWLMNGVADGDINNETDLLDIIQMGYTDDDTYKNLLELFLKTMVRANKSGGLYHNGIYTE